MPELQSGGFPDFRIYIPCVASHAHCPVLHLDLVPLRYSHHGTMCYRLVACGSYGTRSAWMSPMMRSMRSSGFCPQTNKKEVPVWNKAEIAPTRMMASDAQSACVTANQKFPFASSVAFRHISYSRFPAASGSQKKPIETLFKHQPTQWVKSAKTAIGSCLDTCSLWTLRD